MKKLSAPTVYLTFTTIASLSNYLVFTVSAIYRVSIAGLDPLQLVLTGTVTQATVFLCELPTGILADVYSRRLSIVIGTGLIGAAYLLEGMVPVFSTILLAQIIWGIGYTFTSGAQQAWIADEIGAEAAHQIYLRGSQASQVGGFFATFLSVALASDRLGMPLIVAGMLYLGLGVFLLLLMPERPFVQPANYRHFPWQETTQTFRQGLGLVRHQPILLIILGVGVFHGLANEGLDYLWELHFLRHFTFPDLEQLEPIFWFGIINAGANLLNILAVEFVRQRIDRNSLVIPRLLLITDGLLIVSLLAFSQAQGFGMALATCWATDLLRAANDPLYTGWMNQKLDSATRATVFSIGSQMNAIGKILIGPGIGIIAEVSVRSAIAASGVILVPVLLLYLRAMKSELTTNNGPN